MKTLVVLGLSLTAIGFALMKALWALAKWAACVSPIFLGAWLAYEIAIEHWSSEVLWILAPTLILALTVWYRLTLVSWTERSNRELNTNMNELKRLLNYEKNRVR